MARELSNLEHAARRLLEDFGAGRNLTESANGLHEALEASTADICTCCRHWRSACASERAHGGASACRDTTCEGCGGED